MKLIKKLIAIVSSLTIIATISTNVLVHAETNKIILTPTLTKTSETEEIYDLTINVDVSNCTKGEYLYSLAFDLYLPENIFEKDNGFYLYDSAEGYYPNLETAQINKKTY